MLKKPIIVIALLACSMMSYGQAKLTIEDAIAKGLSNNYGLAISLLDSEIAQKNNSWGAVGAYPTITGTAQYNFSKELIDLPKDMTNSVGVSVDANWTLFNGFRIRTAKRINEYKYNLSKGIEAVEIENCISDIVLNYYALSLETELLKYNKTLYTLSKDRYEREKHSASYGGRGIYELIQSESAYLVDNQNYLSQERRVKSARYTLNLAMGVDVGSYWEVDTCIVVPQKEYVLSQLFDLMTNSNNSLKNQYINQKMLEENIAMAKGDILPKVDIKAGGRYNYNNNNTLQPYAGVSVSATIFAGNMKQRNIAIANIEKKIGAISIEQMKRELSTKLMSQYDNYDYNRRILALAQREMEVAKINLTLSQEKYNNGSISSFDYRAVQTSYQRAAYNHLQITFEVLSANVELTRLIGGFVQ